MRQPLESEFSQVGPAAPPRDSSTPSATRPVDATTLDLLKSWQQEDATSDPADPAQLKAAEEELVDFIKAMNDTRTLSGEPLLYP